MPLASFATLSGAMRFVDGHLLIAPTDLATFTTCRHRTGLELAVAHGILHRPAYEDPYAAILRRKGEEHEQGYVDSLRARGLSVVTVARGDGPPTAELLERQTADTLAAMRAGADAIVQARLAILSAPSAAAMAGYADVLIRVDTPSRLGPWSYEAQDTKLARETKGGAILQLCGYSELLASMQGVPPSTFTWSRQVRRPYRRTAWPTTRPTTGPCGRRSSRRSPWARSACGRSTTRNRWSTAPSARGRSAAAAAAQPTTTCRSSPARRASIAMS